MINFNNKLVKGYEHDKNTRMECGMYLASTLSEEDLCRLEARFKDEKVFENGTPWYEFVLSNVKVTLD